MLPFAVHVPSSGWNYIWMIGMCPTFHKIDSRPNCLRWVAPSGACAWSARCHRSILPCWLVWIVAIWGELNVATTIRLR